MRVRGYVLYAGLMAYVGGIAWVLLRADAAWLGDPLWGQETVAVALVVSFPVYLAVVGYEAGADRREIWPLLTERQRIAQAGRTFVGRVILPLGVTVGAHILVVALSRLQDAHFEDASWWPLLTQSLGIVAGVALATAVGSLAPGWTGTVLPAVIWLVATFTDRAGIIKSGIAEFSPSGSLIGYAPDPASFLGRAVWFVLLIGLLVAATIAFSSSVKRRIAWAAVVIVFFAGGQLVGDGDGYDVATAARVKCAGEARQICGPAEIQPLMADFVPVVEGSTAVLSDLGVKLPTKYYAWTAQNDYLHRPWVLLFDPGKPRDSRPVQSIVGQVVGPRSCDVWWGASYPDQKWFVAEQVVDGYVQSQLNLGTTAQFQAFAAARTAAEQRDLITDAATGLAECDPSRIPVEFNDLNG